jgi:phosphoribulokinase
MPPLEVQQDLLIGFRQRVLRRIQASANTGRRLSNFEAEQEEWQQIEQTMLSYPTQP